MVDILSGETEAARRRMAAAARRRVLEAHTAEARAGGLAAHLGEPVRRRAPAAAGAIETAA